MSGFHLGQVPFRTVLIHGLVRDKQGKKFSKSLGNGIDPIEMIDKYGADALRMGLLVGSAIGSDIRFDEDKVKGYKHFANKLWNIARFIQENAGTDEAPLTQEDEELLAEFRALGSDITKDMEEFRIHLAAEKLYHYAWHRLADALLEESKQVFQGADEQKSASRKSLLMILLRDLLALLHPFMPFVTEEIWSSLPGNTGFLMTAPWPGKIGVNASA